MRTRVLAAATALLACGAALAPPSGATVAHPSASPMASRDDGDWSEQWIARSGVDDLHADVLRPRGLAADVRTPVILTVSPYTNHSGQTSADNLTATGPSNRFFDFLDLSGALTKGYTYVMVDLPGDGGSAGCNDWGGQREQAAVRDAVEWAAAQPWSSGRVALFGKSYDGWTGVMGVAQQPKGLAAVVAMEPVYSGYRYMYMNGVRRPNYTGTMQTFQQIDAQPGSLNDSPEYHAHGAPQVWCYGVNLAGTAADTSESGPYWAERNLVPLSTGRTTPVFLTQGFLESNTKPDGAFAWWNGLAGTQNHAWFGQFDHVRGWERDGAGTPMTGREGFVSQVMRFLDQHLKGQTPSVGDPVVAVQDGRGRWRSEQQWPPADSHLLDTTLRAGTYVDDGSGSAPKPTEAAGTWTVSAPLSYEVWLSGEPVVTVGVDGPPEADLLAAVYDIDQAGRTVLVSRGATVLHGTGARTATLTLYGQDWPVAAGHRIGVLLSDADTDQFTYPVTSRQPVTIRYARIGLPFLTYARSEFIDGQPTARLGVIKGIGSTLSAGFLSGAEQPFTVPAPLAPKP